MVLPHTVPYYGPVVRQNLILANDLIAGIKTAKPDGECELEASAETSMKSYRSALQAGQYLQRMFQRTVFADLPQPCTALRIRTI